ncbi:hypothetical protein [Maricaulis sp.]|uniref:hypothetical protein n=1 Tax=Maricaulis sp. TaxID=1486257 RepID=UPI0026355DED|nr:hypothetical protein [Maricaulis sp.]
MLVPEQPLPALVMDARSEFGSDAPLAFDDQGNANVMLKVASGDGGFIVFSRTINPPQEKLEAGDLVCWVPLQHDEELAGESKDPRFGWIGLVFATLEPEWKDGDWVLREFYGDVD